MFGGTKTGDVVRGILGVLLIKKYFNVLLLNKILAHLEYFVIVWLKNRVRKLDTAFLLA